MSKEENDVDIELTGFAKLMRFIWDLLFYLLLVAIIVAAIMFASSKTSDKSIFGYRYYDVLTASMEPEYSVGDLIFVKLTDSADINVGDVVTFNPGGSEDAYLTHRVVEKLDNYQGSGVTCFKTKGDANANADPFIIDESRMIGVVKSYVPYLGYVVLFVQTYYTAIIVFIILFSVFFTLLKKLAEVSAEIKQLEGEDKAEEKAK